mgnify:CR=1 FL=1
MSVTESRFEFQPGGATSTEIDFMRETYLLIGVLAALDADNLRNALVGICVVVNIFCT